MITLKCKRCGKEIITSNCLRTRKKYCSKECRKISKIKKVCQYCGKNFEVCLLKKDTAKFCSKECGWKSRIGKEQSKETKNKISIANGGKNNGMYGKKAWNSGLKGFRAGIKIKKICKLCRKEFFVTPCDDNRIFCSRNCLYISKRGIKLLEETKIKISIANKGKHNSLKTEFKKGLIPWCAGTKGLVGGWNKGKKMSEEYRKKLSIAHIGQICWCKGLKTGYNKKQADKLRGRKLSKEHVEKIRKNTIKWHLLKGKNFISDAGKKRISDAKKGIKRPEISGEKCHLWKGGISKLTDKIRKIDEYKEWRFSIYKRDWFICKMPSCDKIEKSLHAHHIKKFSKIIKEFNIKILEDAINCKELWDINNGITLCKKCHEKVRQHEKEYAPLFQEIVKLNSII